MIALYPYIQPPPEYSGVNLIDYAFIDGIDEFREVVAKADIIIACDKNRAGWRFVYHTQAFEDIGKRLVPAQDLRVVGFAVDFRTILVHRLWGSVGVTKGFAEWGGATEPPQLVDVDTFEGAARYLPPYEGLAAAVNVLRLELDYIQQRIQKPIDCSQSIAIRLCTDLIVRLGGLQKRLVKYFEDDFRFKHRPQGRPAVVRWKASDSTTLRETRLNVEQQASLIKIPDAGVSDHRGRLIFTHESYFAFIFESLHATERWLATGQLEWPSSITYKTIDDETK